tara:strand:+ start:383 stop:601 length:219 start_codon:yes stop_codon:yes gene_type:complete
MDEYITCPVCDTKDHVEWEFPFLAKCKRCSSMWTARGADLIQLKNLSYHKAPDVWWGTHRMGTLIIFDKYDD